MNFDFDFTGALGHGVGVLGSILNAREPRFPRLTIWFGELALTLWRGSTWLAVPLGPLKAVLAWLMMRKTMLEWARMPFSQKVLLGAGVGIAAFITCLFSGKKK